MTPTRVFLALFSYSFALTSVYFRERPLLCDISGGSLKISLSFGCFSKMPIWSARPKIRLIVTISLQQS